MTTKKSWLIVLLGLVGLPCLAICPTADLTGDCIVNLDDLAELADHWLAPYDNGDFATMAAQWLTEGVPTNPAKLKWVTINDPGVPSHEAFNGQMSKYLTTNAQFCQFLNLALSTGDIRVGVDGRYVYGRIGTHSGQDYPDQIYYDTLGLGYTFDGATDGGKSRIHYNGTSYYVESGFEDHPITQVSRYGAMAFGNYFGYRLPTEWEWQAVADYDGSYTYGCGTTINTSIANYYHSVHPYGTTVVGSFGTYGYGLCDMAGNVWEWTSSVNGSWRVIRGGCWSYYTEHCGTAYRFVSTDGTAYSLGFRVCR